MSSRPAARLDSSIRVRLSAEHRLELERHAAAAGVPASTIVRNLIRNHLAKLREAERS